VYGIFVGEYFQRIRIHIQTTAEKLILRGKYDYSKVLMQVSQNLLQAVSREEISEVVQRDMREFLDVSKAGVWYVR
jgi:hypothetical protein